MIDANAKTSLRCSILILNLNAYYFKNNYLFHNIYSKVQIQDSNNKNFFYFKKSKIKDLKVTLLCNNMIMLIKKKGKKDEKKKI